MNAKLTTDDLVLQTDPPRGDKLGSALRALTVAVALLVFGISAPMALADHMGNHERPIEASAGDCTKAESTDASTQTQLAVQDGDVLAGSGPDDSKDEDEEETMPPHPFDGRPW